jgi:catechol 2,3-dioxygenase-like lactoylglutathione lyase family enzyme
MPANAGAISTTPTDRDLPFPDAVLVAMLPVTDIAASARFYTRLLGLTVLREFVHDGRVTGCSLSHPRAGFALSLRLRASLDAPAELRGEHPIIWRVPDTAALERFTAHAAALGLAPPPAGTTMPTWWPSSTPTGSRSWWGSRPGPGTTSRDTNGWSPATGAVTNGRCSTVAIRPTSRW